MEAPTATVQLPAAPEAQANGAKKPRRPRASTSRFPASINAGITVEMAQALERQTPAHGPISQSVYLRMIVHQALLRDDQQYRASFGGNGHA
jgi:hypothetical protein